MSARTFVAVALALAISGSSRAGIFGPDGYDECITDSMAGVQSNLAARAIMDSCRKQFPEKTAADPASRNLSDEEFKLLTGRASGSSSGYFSGRIYNGNSAIVVTHLLVGIATTIGGKDTVKQYSTDVKIPPLTTGSFAFDFILGDKGTEQPWFLMGAAGHSIH